MSEIDSAPVTAAPGYEHVPAAAIAVLRWLNGCELEYVVVGSVARAIHGETGVSGPVAIVPAPYRRNLERLARALGTARAGERPQVELSGVEVQPAADAPLKLTGEQLAGEQRWRLRCGGHDLDVEGRPPGVPSYQELLLESARVELAPGVQVEVGSPEDIELYDHIAHTGRPPELTVSRSGPRAAA